jgi:hypothetical protein
MAACRPAVATVAGARLRHRHAGSRGRGRRAPCDGGLRPRWQARALRRLGDGQLYFFLSFPMKESLTSPDIRTYCVWADQIRRVFQEVEAASPDDALDRAQATAAWQPCDEHDGRVRHLSDTVQDLQSGEFLAVGRSQLCRTCHGEIVATINDSVFRLGECDACERRRYESQPALLDAACLALDEIDQWNAVMGGSEDERTHAALAALQNAITNATRS